MKEGRRSVGRVIEVGSRAHGHRFERKMPNRMARGRYRLKETGKGRIA
jgi:hypothetical protein